jgi:hypothetical protein
VSDRETPTPPRRLPGGWTLTRDILSFLGGWALIFQQAAFVEPSQVNEAFLVLGGSLVGVPGLALGASSVLDAIRSRAGTGGVSDSPPSDPSSPPSSSPAG